MFVTPKVLGVSKMSDAFVHHESVPRGRGVHVLLNTAGGVPSVATGSDCKCNTGADCLTPASAC